ncbi:phage tail fiber protein [Paludibaculum fermentans]|uniref:phage tail fiber protein n=1 Tax=Paludibaculum fermentans TaxID=1473598 RepID=UPI003EB9C8AE
MSISNYLENKILTDNLTGSYLSLHTADPGETGTSEVTGGSYSRKSWTFSGPTNGVITSSATVLFTGMPAVSVTHFGVWDAATGGNCLWTGPATASKTYGAGDTAEITSGTLTVTID